jgi:integrase
LPLGNAQAGDLELGLEGLGAGLVRRRRRRRADFRARRPGADRRRRSRPPARDLRHTFGTLAVRKAPLTDLQAWIGHRDIQTTMQYVHYVPQHDAAAKLTAAFSGEGVTALAAEA